jgi:hypothetical protein
VKIVAFKSPLCEAPMMLTLLVTMIAVAVCADLSYRIWILSR